MSNRKYMAIGSQCWGKGWTVAEAIKKATDNGAYAFRDRRQRTRFKGERVFGILNVPEDAWVDQMGSIRWDDNEEQIYRLGYVDIDGKYVAGPDDQPEVGKPEEG